MEQNEMLEMLIRFADGIADTFGKSCETVIHQIRGESYKIIYIRNGEVSGRKVGDTRSLIGAEFPLHDFYKGKDLVNFGAKTREGKAIKSTTLHWKTEGAHYSLGINYDYTLMQMMEGLLGNFTRTNSPYEEIFAGQQDVNLEELFHHCLKEVGIPLTLMGRRERREVVRLLDEKGAFTIKNSVTVVADWLGLSRYTVYNYLKIIRGEREAEGENE